MPERPDCRLSSARRPASLRAATMRSSSISTSAVLDPEGPETRPAIAVGSILSESTCFLPFILTVTAPPPEVASTTVLARRCSICCCISCAWPSIFWMSCGFNRCPFLWLASEVVLRLAPKVKDAAHLCAEELLCLLHQGIVERVGLDRALGGVCGGWCRRGGAIARQHDQLRAAAGLLQRCSCDALGLRVHGEREHSLLHRDQNGDGVAAFGD